MFLKGSGGLVTLSYQDKLDIRNERRLRFFNIVMVVSFLSGTVGQLIEGVSLIDSLYGSLVMFVLSYTSGPTNILINIGRFGAAFFTLNAVLAIVGTFFMIVGDRIKGQRKDSMYVYGDSNISEELMQTRKNVIDGRNGFVPASNYVLVGNEVDNLHFYVDHRDRLAERKVYLKTETLPGISLGHEHLRSFCLEELGAEEFWKKYSLVEKAFNEDGSPAHLSIAIIGFNKLGEEILSHGLRACAFTDVTWHIFGDTNRYRMLHANLDELDIHCYPEEWFNELDIVKNADMIIVTSQNHQLNIIYDFFLVAADWKVHICSSFGDSEEGKSIFLQHRSGSVPEENLIFFDWRKAGGNLERLRQQETAESIKKDNLKKLIADEWENLDTFRRYAYLSLLDFRDLKQKLVDTWGDKIDEDMIVRIMHRRMRNYYLINNWCYAEFPDPDDPSADENNTLRLHRGICPYDDLSPERKEREKEIVRRLYY